MLTKWYRKFLEYLPVANNYMTYGPQVKIVDGTTKHLLAKSNNTYAPWHTLNFTTSSVGTGFRVGSGTTTPTDQDYALESVIESGIIGTVTSTAQRKQNGDINLLYTLTITNTSSSGITISEVGYYGMISCSATEGGTASNNYIMFDRAVLNNPVTVNPSESVAINYHVTVSEES